MKCLQFTGLGKVSLCSPGYLKRASNLLPLEWSSWFLRNQRLNHLCFPRFDSNLNVTLPHLQIWISMVHLIVHLIFKLNNSPKEAKSVQAWFPHGGSRCASVLHACAAWHTWHNMLCKLLFLSCKILIQTREMICIQGFEVLSTKESIDLCSTL